MTPAPRPGDEPRRLESLRATAQLDTPADPSFDALARLAARICGAPLAAVALVDADRVWFKARCGVLPQQAPRDSACCAWTILDDDLLVVPDVAADPRFAHGDAARAEPPVRFYAGCPLRGADGHALGTLCVMDHRPRTLGALERETLATLGAQVIAQLELRRQTLQTRRQNEELERTCLLLSQERARLRAILETAVDAVITIDAGGRVESFNPAAERIFGWSAAEVVGRNVAMLMPEPHASRHDAYLQAHRSGGPARVIGIGREAEGLRRDGRVFPMYLAVSEVRLGEGCIYTGFVRDLSEAKEIERMKNEFVSVVSHELRTPLTSIRGSLGLLEAGAAGPLEARGAELVTIARSNTDRLIRLVNDILDLERIESGKIELDRQPLTAAEIVESTFDGLRALAAQAEVTLLAEIAPQPAFPGDRDRLVQVLTNLVSNAVKFSPRGAPVRVRCYAVDGAARFEVIDRGEGIAPEQMHRLFGRFQQLDASDRRRKGGSGLGLAISKAIVEQHGGRAGVDSAPGRGSTFWVELPLAPTALSRTA